MIQNWI